MYHHQTQQWDVYKTAKKSYKTALPHILYVLRIDGRGKKRKDLGIKFIWGIVRGWTPQSTTSTTRRICNPDSCGVPLTYLRHINSNFILQNVPPLARMISANSNFYRFTNNRIVLIFLYSLSLMQSISRYTVYYKYDT